MKYLELRVGAVMYHIVEQMIAVPGFDIKHRDKHGLTVLHIATAPHSCSV